MGPLLRTCRRLSRPLAPTAMLTPPAGLIATVNGDTSPGSTGWIRLYNLTFLVGLAAGVVVFWLLNYLSPPSGIGKDAPFHHESDVPVPDSPRPPEHGAEGKQGWQSTTLRRESSSAHPRQL